jgi:hypothetical protein
MKKFCVEKIETMIEPMLSLQMIGVGSWDPILKFYLTLSFHLIYRE